MEALIRLNSHITIKVDGADLQTLIENMTIVENAIGFEKCGKCGSDNIGVRMREADGNKFYELYCKDCGAVLQLGTSKESKHLYKKKMQTDDKGKAVKDDNGKPQYLPNNGWLKWNYQTKKME